MLRITITHPDGKVEHSYSKTSNLSSNQEMLKTIERLSPATWNFAHRFNFGKVHKVA